MQQLRYIRLTTVEELKKYVQTLYERQKTISVTTQKTRAKSLTHSAKIEGVYAKFFTVKDCKLGLTHTIQYIDILTGSIEIAEAEE